MVAAARKPSKRDKTVAAILAAARGLLDSKGLVDSSVAEVAKIADVSEATVFSYFRTRRDLMARVISDWMLPVVARIESDVKLIEGTRARLNFFANRHLRELAAAPGLHRLIYRELHWEGYYGSELHCLNKRYAAIVVSIYEDGKRGGEVRESVDCEVARDMFFGALHHVGWRTYMNDRSVDIECTAQMIAELAFVGIASQRQQVDAASRIENAVTRLEAFAERSTGS